MGHIKLWLGLEFRVQGEGTKRRFNYAKANDDCSREERHSFPNRETLAHTQAIVHPTCTSKRPHFLGAIHKSHNKEP